MGRKRLATLSARAVVAIPACNEAARIEACLAALAAQRDGCGAPVQEGAFEILVFANNCSDATAEVAKAFSEICPHPIVVVSETLAQEHATAGWARKRAMDVAAGRLQQAGRHDGLLFTTDADSCVCPTWFAGTTEALSGGVDCVAGYIDAFPAEIMRLGPAFVRRGRLEDRYLRLMAEIHALCDPRAHDPWPNHRVSSGASLAVTLAAYVAVGGMPPQALGEDAAFTRALEAAGLLVRHPMSVTVGTSCRFDGRAKGGAADTMRLRHALTEAPCDDDVEPAWMVVRRALRRGALRIARREGRARTAPWARRFGLTFSGWQDLLDRNAGLQFEAFWTELTAPLPEALVLPNPAPARPSGPDHQCRTSAGEGTRLRQGPVFPIGGSSTKGAGLIRSAGAGRLLARYRGKVACLSSKLTGCA